MVAREVDASKVATQAIERRVVWRVRGAVLEDEVKEVLAASRIVE